MLASLIILASAASQNSEKLEIESLLSGTFSNEEQVYFEKDAGRESPPWASLEIARTENGWTLSEIDAHGREQGEPQNIVLTKGDKRDNITVENCSRYFDRSDTGWKFSAIQSRKACRQKFQIIEIGADAIKLRFADGVETTLKRARDVECWAAIPKKTKKEDGSTDWLFKRKLVLHDQGGRATIGGGDSGAEEVTLRMRAVHWPPPSTNRPSMVLYIHKDNPDSAASYSWADINASRVGINLRWMQASCTIKGAERASEVTNSNFRG